jgi:hypothetical protein
MSRLENRITAFAIAIWLLWAGIVVGFWAFVIAVAWHFIKKAW